VALGPGRKAKILPVRRCRLSTVLDRASSSAKALGVIRVLSLTWL
jgi:hypothetical protein